MEAIKLEQVINFGGETLRLTQLLPLEDTTKIKRIIRTSESLSIPLSTRPGRRLAILIAKVNRKNCEISCSIRGFPPIPVGETGLLLDQTGLTPYEGAFAEENPKTDKGGAAQELGDRETVGFVMNAKEYLKAELELFLGYVLDEKEVNKVAAVEKAAEAKAAKEKAAVEKAAEAKAAKEKAG